LQQGGSGFESHLPRRRASSSDARASGRSQEEGRLGTTMPTGQGQPSIQGDVPGPDPARLPLARRLPGWARLLGAAPAGVCLARQGPRCGAPLPPRAACLVHVWSTRHRSRAVRNGLQRSPAVGRSRRLQARSCGNRLRSRTLIRMRSQVQVLAGPPHPSCSEAPANSCHEAVSNRGPASPLALRRVAGPFVGP
jgi:hypothetical protein